MINIRFFLSDQDWSSLSPEFAKMPVYFLNYGRFDHPQENLILPSTLANLIGRSSTGSTTSDDTFLVIDNEFMPSPELLSSEETPYYYSMRSVPDSASFRPGGSFGSTVIRGEISYRSESVPGSRVAREIASLFRNFTKIKGYFIGSDALDKLNEGIRLTSDVNSPSEYDLKS